MSTLAACSIQQPSSFQGYGSDPRRIIAFSSAQRNRLSLSEFDAKIPEWWVSGQCQNGPIWIPAALVFYPFAQTPAWLTTFAVSSNGVAAYKTADGALRRAWLELVERDAFQRATPDWENQASAPDLRIQAARRCSGNGGTHGAIRGGPCLAPAEPDRHSCSTSTR